MRAVLLQGAPQGHRDLEALEGLVREQLARQEAQVTAFQLRDLPMAACQGEFDCWVKTPGVCKARDAQAEIAQAVHDADLCVLLTPITFGGYGTELKKALDRLIGLLLPDFEPRAAATHHPPRYANRPRLLAIGWQASFDATRAGIFRDLVESTALDFSAPAFGVCVVTAAREGWPAAVEQLLASTRVPGNCSGDARGALRDLHTAAEPRPGIGLPFTGAQVALLVGSAKPRGTSTSESLANALADGLRALGTEVQIEFASRFIHLDEAARAAARRLADADLLVLVSPLYVDSLPYLATRALEQVALARAQPGPRWPGRFAALINCGFPEAEQNRTALEIAHQFARETGFHWAGGLALGGGGFIDGRPLESLGGPAVRVRRALELAAQGLVTSGTVPLRARRLMARRLVPPWLYRWVGALGWRQRARLHGLGREQLRARPLDRFTVERRRRPRGGPDVQSSPTT